MFTLLTLKVLNFWKLTSYCSLKPLWSGMGGVVPARTSPTLHPPSPPTVHQLSRLALFRVKSYTHFPFLQLHTLLAVILVRSVKLRLVVAGKHGKEETCSYCNIYYVVAIMMNTHMKWGNVRRIPWRKVGWLCKQCFLWCNNGIYILYSTEVKRW